MMADSDTLGNENSLLLLPPLSPEAAAGAGGEAAAPSLAMPPPPTPSLAAAPPPSATPPLLPEALPPSSLDLAPPPLVPEALPPPSSLDLAPPPPVSPPPPPPSPPPSPSEVASMLAQSNLAASLAANLQTMTQVGCRPNSSCSPNPPNSCAGCAAVSAALVLPSSARQPHTARFLTCRAEASVGWITLRRQLLCSQLRPVLPLWQRGVTRRAAGADVAVGSVRAQLVPSPSLGLYALFEFGPAMELQWS